MHEYKIYLTSAAFICLTAVKLCFPAVPAQIRQQAIDILCSGADYTGTIQAMGRSLGQGELESQLVQVLRHISTAPPNSQDAIQVSETLETAVPPARSSQPSAIPEETEKPRLMGKELPDNVSEDMPQLPFEYASPVPKAVSSGFGYREHPTEGEILFHYGTDLAADLGEPILAFADGTVSAAGTDEGYGNYYILEHTDGYTTLYAHLSEFAVSEGQEIKKGQLIGYAGQTGKATGPHLHFELMHQGIYLDPEYYL